MGREELPQGDDKQTKENTLTPCQYHYMTETKSESSDQTSHAQWKQSGKSLGTSGGPKIGCWPRLAQHELRDTIPPLHLLSHHCARGTEDA